MPFRISSPLASLGPIALVGLMGGASGCERERSGPGTDFAGSPVVALAAGVQIRAEDVARQMRARQTDARRALADLVTFEILARAAAEAANEPDKDDADAIAAARVQRIIEREIEPRIHPSEIPEAEVRALYERGKRRFVHGRLVEVDVLCVFTGARMKAEVRARAEETARRLRAFVDGRPEKTAADFQVIANDPAWVDARVTFTTVWQDDDAPFPPVVGQAVKTLRRPGDTTNLVGDETGYYIARYVSERPPENIAFADAAPGLRRDMAEPWRRQRFLQLTLEMAAGHDIQIFPENFPLLVDASAKQ